MNGATRRKLGLIAIWAIALLVAFFLDRRAAQWVHTVVPLDKRVKSTHVLIIFLRLPGYFWTSLAIAVLLAIFHRDRLRAAGALLLSGLVAGAAYSIIKWIAGRHRPFKGPGHNIAPLEFHPFPGGIRGLFDPESALCFPSGDATLAFASATCLAILLPRWRYLFFLYAIVTAAERVLENAHYLSDAVTGAGLGVVIGWSVTRWVVGRPPATALVTEN